MPQPYGQVPDKYSMYSPQGAHRLVFSHFQNSGIDAFASPNSQNVDGYLALDNVLPAVTGGFLRRWGTTSNSLIAMSTIERLFPYQVSAQAAIAGDYYSGFGNYYAIFGSDNAEIKAIYNEGTNDNQLMNGFSGGDVYATTSRSFMYAFDGVSSPKKKHFAILTDTQSLTGIAAPQVNGILSITGSGHSYNPSTTTATVNGIGSGAAVTLTFENANMPDGPAGPSNYTLIGGIVTSEGSGYDSTTTITIADTGTGTGAHLTPTIYGGKLVGVSINGPITFAVGRRYALALINSKTGHCSDFWITGDPGTFQSNNLATYPQLAATYVDSTGATQNVSNLACSNIMLELLLESPTDPQVDTVLLLAAADGGDTNHLYQVTQIPLTSFRNSSLIPGSIYYLYTDTLADTYNDFTLNVYTSGNPLPPTLLDANLWVDVDSFGNTIGIFENTPPLPAYNKPVINQGRMFTTDGKAVYFSKSIDEVTTSTGLITSKWEEAWPASNELDIGFTNEIITGLLSDTTYLYIGTTQNIYRLSGTSINNFEIQCVFRNIGVLSQDTWTVVYKENLPAGYMWVTPDYKIMLSDFNNYREVGKPIYPLLNGAVEVFIQPCTFGPYALAMVKTSEADIFIFNLLSDSWYRWRGGSDFLGYTPNPILSYTNSAGISHIFFTTPVQTGTVGGRPVFSPYLGFFDPAATQDAFPTAATPITWTIRTGWQDFGDSTMIKVINEMECWTSESSLSTTVFTLTGNNNINSSTRACIAAPTAAMKGLLKGYYAGAPTGGKLCSFEITCTSSSVVPDVLDQFVVDFFPFGRI